MAASAVKIRAFFGAVFAIIVVIVFGSIAATALGMDLPILRDIAGTFGVTGE